MRILLSLCWLSFLGINIMIAQTGEKGSKGEEGTVQATVREASSPKEPMTPNDQVVRGSRGRCRAAQSAEPSDSCSYPTCNGHYMWWFNSVECTMDQICGDLIDRYVSKSGMASYSDGYN